MLHACAVRPTQILSWLLHCWARVFNHHEHNELCGDGNGAHMNSSAHVCNGSMVSVYHKLLMHNERCSWQDAFRILNFTEKKNMDDEVRMNGRAEVVAFIISRAGASHVWCERGRWARYMHSLVI